MFCCNICTKNKSNSTDDIQAKCVLLPSLLCEELRFSIYFPFFSIHSEVEQSLAGLISDRATDEVVEALTRYRRGLGISDSPSMHFDDHQTPDVVRSRSSQVSEDIHHTIR